MDFSDQTTAQLSEQFTNIVRSKFVKPLLDEPNRKAIDTIIFAIWQELKVRKEAEQGE
jgi:hypothetical protein